MSILGEFNDLNELNKISSRWKNQQNNGNDKHKKQDQPPASVSSKLEDIKNNSVSQSFINESQQDSVDIESFNINNPNYTNPWGNLSKNLNDKENVLNTINQNHPVVFQKGKVRTHAPQVLDEDTEQFKLRLEHLLNVFKTEATSEFMLMKRSMLDEQKQTIQQETERYLQMYEEKVQELSDNKNQLSEKIKGCQLLENRCELMAQKLGARGNLIKQTKLLQIVINSFKKYKQIQQQKKYKQKLSLKLRRRLLQQNIFRFWKILHKDEITQKKNSRILDYHRKEMDDLVHKFKKEHEILENRLKEAQEGLDEANKMKIGMQENLKRAFMRGVNALNFEAMSVISGNQQTNMTETDFLNEFSNLQKKQTDATQQMKNNTLSSDINFQDSQQSFTQNTSTVQFHNQNRIENNEHKWKNAPLVGKNPNQTQIISNESLYQQEQIQNQTLGNIQKQMIVQNLVQQGIQNLYQQQQNQQDDDFSERSSVCEDEGRVIKVNIHQDHNQKKPKQQIEPQKKCINQSLIYSIYNQEISQKNPTQKKAK